MQAYKYVIDVDKKGKITIPNIPQIKSKTVEVIILPLKDDNYLDLTNASNSSTEFWDNPEDEVWDHV